VGPMTARRVAAALATAVAILVSGAACAALDPARLSEEKPVDPATVLAARPRLEDVVARYAQMQERMRAQLDAELGPFRWLRFREETESGCGREFPWELGGHTLHGALWGVEAAIPDADWARAREIVAGIGAGYGFVTDGVQLDRPGHHLLTGMDHALGASYQFGSEVFVTLRVTSGCHLPTATGAR
jgi:hypothetical protein